MAFNEVGGLLGMNCSKARLDKMDSTRPSETRTNRCSESCKYTSTINYRETTLLLSLLRAQPTLEAFIAEIDPLLLSFSTSRRAPFSHSVSPVLES